MQKRVLVLTTSAVILAWGTMAASAQENMPGAPTMQQQPQILQQRQELERQLLERQLQGVQTPRRGVEDDNDQDGYGGGMMGWRYGPGWRHHEGWRRGPMGPGMMGQGGMGPGSMGLGSMGPGSMGSGMMMRMLFSLMDSDGDGTISLQEFQAAHERIFKAMDANKDGSLTLEEIQAFMQGTRRSVPRQ
jgi:hypothetical protein